MPNENEVVTFYGGEEVVDDVDMKQADIGVIWVSFQNVLDKEDSGIEASPQWVMPWSEYDWHKQK